MNMNDVAIRIQKLLDERGEKLKPVCEKIGVKYYSIYPWWSRPGSNADPDKVKLFADYFGVPIDYLRFGTPIKERHLKDKLRDKVDTLDTNEQEKLADFVEFLLSQRQDASD